MPLPAFLHYNIDKNKKNLKTHYGRRIMAELETHWTEGGKGGTGANEGEISPNSDPPILQLKGEISFSDLPVFEKSAESAVKKTKKHLLLDLSDLNYISSSGLRIILKMQKTLTDLNKSLLIFGLNDFVQNVFQTAGFDKIFSIHPDKQSALKNLNS